MLDDNKLSEYLKNSTAFCMKLKKSKKELQKFLEYHPESSILMEIRRDARQNNGVKLLKIVLRKFGGDSLYWKYFNETFEAYGVCVCVRVCMCVCVCVCVYLCPFTVQASSVWISYTTREQINDAVLKALFSYARSLHRYFRMRHMTLQTNHFILFTN